MLEVSQVVGGIKHYQAMLKSRREWREFNSTCSTRKMCRPGLDKKWPNKMDPVDVANGNNLSVPSLHICSYSGNYKKKPSDK